MTRVGGIVLAGGRSRRMGADKALLRLDGEHLASRVARALRAGGAGPVVVVRAADQAPPDVSDARVVADGTPDLGPLEGLRTGLAALEGAADVAVVAPADAPALAPELVRALVRALADDPTLQAAVPVRDGRVQPLTAAYRLDVLATAAALLASGERRARALVDACVSLRLDEAALLEDDALRRADPTLASLDDVDEPGDLARLRVDPGRADSPADAG